MPDTAPYIGPYSTDAYASGSPETYSAPDSGKSKFDWNQAFSGIMGAFTVVPGIIAATKGNQGYSGGGGAYYDPNAPLNPTNGNLWLYGIIGFFVLLLIIIGIVVAVRNSKKSKAEA